jgi:hypothetical protein
MQSWPEHVEIKLLNYENSSKTFPSPICFYKYFGYTVLVSQNNSIHKVTAFGLDDLESVVMKGRDFFSLLPHQN